MKAAVIHGYGGPEVLRYEEFPEPVPGPGEVLVRVAASCVNPFDYKLRSGAMKERIPVQFPAILGLDLSGSVEAVGDGVDAFTPGDKVFAHAKQTYAELCVVKASDLARMPDEMDMVLAAAIPTVTTTGAQLATLALGIGDKGRSILVTGAIGMVGRSAVYTAKKAGAKVIAGVLKRQLSEAQEIGADGTVALDDPDAMASLEKLDAVADTVNGATANTLISKVKEGGIFASVLGPPSEAARFPKVSVKAMQVVGDPESLLQLAEAVLRKQLIIPVGERFSLQDISKAHAAAENGAKGKVVVTV